MAFFLGRFAVFRVVFLLVILLLAVAACAPIAAPFSEASMRNAAELRTRSLALVAASGAPFETGADAATALLADIEAARAEARALPRNGLVAEQWRLIGDPAEGLMGGFVAEWRRKGRFGAAFREHYAAEIARAFDALICAQTAGRGPAGCNPV